MYVFMNLQKKNEASEDLPPEITWEFAQKEIAQVKGFATGSAGLTKGIYSPIDNSTLNLIRVVFYSTFHNSRFKVYSILNKVLL